MLEQVTSVIDKKFESGIVDNYLESDDYEI